MGSNETGSHARRLSQAPRTVAMSVMLVVAVFVGMGLDRALVQTGIAATSLTRADEFETLEETYEVIRENYVLQDEISDEELIYGAASGMVDALGDTGHSTFLNPEEAIEYEQSLEDEFIGIGVQVDTEGEFPVIIAPMQGSPAFEAGIRPGDTIIEVDGQSLEGMDPSEAVDLITGEVGTDVTLKLIRAEDNQEYEVTITRAEIQVNPVSWTMLPGGVMWLQLDQFSEGAGDAVEDALVEGKELGMTGLIFDLRGNPGGFTHEAQAVAEQFLPDGTPLYQDADQEGNIEVHETRGSRGEYLDGPMVVLVDSRSASSSEIVASAIRDNDRAPLLGETTFGVGTVVLPYSLSDGSMVALGYKQLLTGQGNRLFQVGVEPTTEVLLDPATEFPALIIAQDADADHQVTEAELGAIGDEQLSAAYEELTAGQAP